MVTKAQSVRWAKQVRILLLATPLLVACETVSTRSHLVTEKSLTDKEKGTVDLAFSAAMTPLEDLGVRKRKIPEVLTKLMKDPYQLPADFKCDTVKTEMADLSLILGPDVDAAPKVALSAQEQYMEVGGNLMQDAVVSLVRSQTDFLPFRSILRRLTGANSHEKAVNKALNAGQLRRAYLRGLADAKFGDSCMPRPKIVTAAAEEKKDSPALEFVKKW